MRHLDSKNLRVFRNFYAFNFKRIRASLYLAPSRHLIRLFFCLIDPPRPLSCLHGSNCLGRKVNVPQDSQAGKVERRLAPERYPRTSQFTNATRIRDSRHWSVGWSCKRAVTSKLETSNFRQARYRRVYLVKNRRYSVKLTKNRHADSTEGWLGHAAPDSTNDTKSLHPAARIEIEWIWCGFGACEGVYADG